MVDRPIIFSESNVLALWDGKKTQTRRLATSPLAACRQGDRLWVRETFAVAPRNAWNLPKVPAPDPDEAAYFRAGFDRSGQPRWTPSIHMPRWASRLTLAVLAVRLERLHAISDHDARAEGVADRAAFQQLWSSLHGPRAWDENPEVVALTVLATRRNIDASSGVPLASWQVGKLARQHAGEA